MRVLLVFAGFLVVIVIAFVAFTSLLPGGSDTDCSKVSLPTADAWAQMDPADQQSLAGDLNRCSKLDGLTQAQVQAALGAPANGGTNQGGGQTVLYELSNGQTADGAERAPDKWEITFGDDGEVTDSTITDTSG